MSIGLHLEPFDLYTLLYSWLCRKESGNKGKVMDSKEYVVTDPLTIHSFRYNLYFCSNLDDTYGEGV
jgi:hypothetical protein